MNKYPKISISVPVYKVEKYLDNCIKSLIDQTLNDIEIILVDDGSPDSCGDICDKYAEMDNRIRVIHKENGGLGAARQSGLEAARGEYFCVCDADDWVELDMYEQLYNKAVETGADIVICDYTAEYSDGSKRCSNYGSNLPTTKERLIDDALNGAFPCSVWRRIYKREIFKKYNIIWEEGINMGEDVLITLKILQYSLKWSYLPICLYHYRRMPSEESYTNKVTLSSYNQMLKIQDWIESNLDKKRYVKGINHYLINIAFAGLRVEEGMTAGYYRITSTKRLCVSSLITERTLKSMVILWSKFFGYKAGRGLYKLLYKRVYK